MTSATATSVHPQHVTLCNCLCFTSRGVHQMPFVLDRSAAFPAPFHGVMILPVILASPITIAVPIVTLAPPVLSERPCITLSAAPLD